MHDIMTAFFQRGYPCVSLDYRLKDADPAVQVGDIREGMALADHHLRMQGIEQPFVLYGSSAGGHLALLAGLAAQGACGESFRGATPGVAGVAVSCAAITFEPWDEMFPESWNAICEAVGVPYAEEPERYRRFSPRRYGDSDSPPLFFLLGECEHMFPNDQTIEWVGQLKALGARADYRIYPAAEHGFFYAMSRRSQRMACTDLLRFLQSLEATKESQALSVESAR